MQLIKECKLLWQNEHVAKMSKSAHHRKIAFFGLEIDITKATSDLDLFRFRVKLAFVVVDYCNCSKVLDFTFSSRSDFWSKFTQNRLIKRPSVCGYEKTLFLSQNIIFHKIYLSLFNIGGQNSHLNSYQIFKHNLSA